MKPYDKDEAARLVQYVRDRKADGIAGPSLVALADQLEATAAEIERLTADLDNAIGPHCSSCGNAIDPDCCWCGDGPGPANRQHAEDHPFIPRGCDCGRAERDWKAVASARGSLLWQACADRDQLRAKSAQLEAERDTALASEQVERDRYQTERAANVALGEKRDAMLAVVEAAVRVAELDKALATHLDGTLDEHPGLEDAVGQKAEADLYEAVRERSRAVDAYRARKP